MSSEPPKIDFAKQPADKLRDLRRRYESAGYPELALKITLELAMRGAARSNDFAALRWNRKTVAEALARFKEVASFQGNSRTSFTEAGGRKRDGSMWVDAYCAMKTADRNYVFVCYIAKPGDDPEFRLLDGENILRVYTFDELDAAFLEWQKLRHSVDPT